MLPLSGHDRQRGQDRARIRRRSHHARADPERDHAPGRRNSCCRTSATTSSPAACRGHAHQRGQHHLRCRASIGGGSLTLINGGTIMPTRECAGDRHRYQRSSPTPGRSKRLASAAWKSSDRSRTAASSGRTAAASPLAGDVTGAGDLRISGSATLELGGPTSNGIIIDPNATGVLVLDDATGFNGAISGLNGTTRSIFATSRSARLRS